MYSQVNTYLGCTNDTRRCPKMCANSIGDGTCNHDCDLFECLWDGGDCDDIFTALGRHFDVDASTLHIGNQQTRRFASSNPFTFGGIIFGIIMGVLMSRCMIARNRARIRRGETYSSYDLEREDGSCDRSRNSFHRHDITLRPIGSTTSSCGGEASDVGPALQGTQRQGTPRGSTQTIQTSNGKANNPN